jgi:phage terminase large subunit
MKFSKLFQKIAFAFKAVRFIINQGGTSSGKTYSTLQFLILWALKSKKHRLVSVVAESIPHLKRGAYRDFLKILMESGLYKEDNHNKTDFTYQLGSFHFEFFSADNDAKLRGARRDVLYVNECNNISWDSFTQLEIRTREKIFLDFNPVSRFWAHTKIMMPGQKYEFIKSTYKDNVDHLTGKPLLEQSIIDAIESRKPVYDSDGNLISGDEQFWKVYGLGEVGSLEGVVFSNWQTVDSIPSDGKWTAYGLDFGFTNDPTTIIKVVYQGGELWIEELAFETGLTNPEIVNKLKSFGIGSLDDIIADSAEPKSIAEIRRGGFRACRGVKKGPDSINNGIDILKRFRINIHKKSVNLIEEFSNYQWMKTKDGDYLNKPIDNYNHGIDAVRYVCFDKIGMNRQERKGIKRRN